MEMSREGEGMEPSLAFLQNLAKECTDKLVRKP